MDENKRLINIRKHGVYFLDVQRIFESDTVIIKDNRFDYGEQRWLALGLLKGQVVIMVYTENKSIIRIISIRKGTKYEQRTYFEQITY